MTAKELALWNIDNLVDGGALNTWVSNAKSEINADSDELENKVYKAEIALKELADFIDNPVRIEQEDNEKKGEIKEMLQEELFPLITDNWDRIAIIDAILDDVYQDVDETADPENWHSGDVRIAIVRVLKKRLGCPE